MFQPRILIAERVNSESGAPLAADRHRFGGGCKRVSAVLPTGQEDLLAVLIIRGAPSINLHLVPWLSFLPPDLPPNGGTPWDSRAQRSAHACHI
jgi:hypothetical protein